jgi:hypothetical protein
LFRRIESRLYHQAATLAVEDVVETAPSAEHCHPAAQVGNVVQPFEDADVGVGTELVAVDPVVRGAGDYFVVARVRKKLLIGDAGAASQRLVAEELAVLRNRSPQKRKYDSATLGRVVAPETVEQRRFVDPTAAFPVVQ